jgi:hypothetical protein
MLMNGASQHQPNRSDAAGYNKLFHPYPALFFIACNDFFAQY